MPKETVTIQGMPSIWSSEVQFFPADISGSFAKWAVKQSPYVVPDNLSEAIELVYNFARSWNDAAFAPHLIKMTCHEIHVRLEAFFKNTKIIEAWNRLKSDKELSFDVNDKYRSWNEQEYDIIDLGALARNISCDLTLEDVYGRAHD